MLIKVRTKRTASRTRCFSLHASSLRMRSIMSVWMMAYLTLAPWICTQKESSEHTKCADVRRVSERCGGGARRLDDGAVEEAEAGAGAGAEASEASCKSNPQRSAE